MSLRWRREISWYVTNFFLDAGGFRVFVYRSAFLLCVYHLFKTPIVHAEIKCHILCAPLALQSVAYKNAVGARRASWRIISSVEQKEKSKGNSQNVPNAEEYRKKVEKELSNICNTILSLLDKHLIPHSTSVSLVCVCSCWLLVFKLYCWRSSR
jgi:hypothetical protein